MREKIILAPGLKESSLLKTIALHQGKTLGVRVFNAFTLAEFVLKRNGEKVPEVMDGDKEKFIIESFIREIPYFKAAGFSDSKSLAKALGELRLLFEGESEQGFKDFVKKAEFKEKNEAIYEAYKLYRKRVVFDRIDLLNKVIEMGLKIEGDCYVLKGIDVSPLERKLLESVSKTGVKEIEYLDLFKTGEVRKPEYLSSYGKTAEVEYILERILKGGYPLDECLIVSLDDSYNELFASYFKQFGLAYSDLTGIASTKTSAMTLLKLLKIFSNEGRFGLSALENLVYDGAFDTAKLMEKLECNNLSEVVRMAGDLRFGFDGQLNLQRAERASCSFKERDLTYYPALLKLGEELGKGPAYLIGEYSCYRDIYDLKAREMLKKELEAYLALGENNITGIYDALIAEKVRVNASEGVLISDLKGALSLLRKHIFICGLDSGVFPGSLRENYLLLDNDLLSVSEMAKTSVVKLEQKKELLKLVVTSACHLGLEVLLSFSAYDLVGLRPANPSSCLFEIYRLFEGDDSSIKDMENSFIETSFFKSDISKLKELSKAYVNNAKIVSEVVKYQGVMNSPFNERAFSPSQIVCFNSCQRLFFLQYVLGLKVKQERDANSIIEGNEFGDLIHELMERKARNSGVDRETFMSWASKCFDDFLACRIAESDYLSELEREVFLEVAANAYDSDPGNEVVLAESRLRVRHESGIELKGFPDRVERTAEGLIIADYKTGKRVKHVEDDFDSCLQTLVYACILEKQGYEVVDTEYRYLRDPQTIRCIYNDYHKDKLSEVLNSLRIALDSGIYSKATDDENCKYCPFKDVCESFGEVTGDE